LTKSDKQIKDEILFYWILHKSDAPISISNLIYDLPLEVRGWWKIKDSTFRQHMTKKAKQMEAEGYLVSTMEPATQGFRYLYSRIEGHQILIPDWFKENILVHMKKGKVKISCQNCVYREDCAIRKAYTLHKRDLTLTPQIKNELIQMCKAIKKTEEQLEREMRQKGNWKDV